MIARYIQERHALHFRTRAFPEHTVLEKAEIERVMSSVREKYFAPVKDQSELIHYVELAGHRTGDFPEPNISIKPYRLSRVLKRAKFSIPSSVLLSFFGSGDMDLFDFQVLDRELHRLFYLGPDELLLIADDMSWIMHIDHSGYIYMLP